MEQHGADSDSLSTSITSDHSGEQVVVSDCVTAFCSDPSGQHEEEAHWMQGILGIEKGADLVGGEAQYLQRWIVNTDLLLRGSPTMDAQQSRVLGARGSFRWLHSQSGNSGLKEEAGWYSGYRAGKLSGKKLRSLLLQKGG